MKTPSDPVFPFVASRRQFIKVTGLAVGAIALPAWDCESAQAGLSLSEKHDLADIAVSTARRLGASYADIRINRYRAESITTRERQVIREELYSAVATVRFETARTNIASLHEALLQSGYRPSAEMPV